LEFQLSDDSLPLAFITEEQQRELRGRPPATGAWRVGDPVGNRRFSETQELRLESGKTLKARLAFETWGELNEQRDNAVLVLHALTGDSHTVGSSGDGHKTGGWWNGVVGPGCAIDTKKYFVVTPNILGGCQGSTGPATLASSGNEYGPDFPSLTIRDQARSVQLLADELGIARWAAVIGGSMAGMHAMELAIEFPESVGRLALLAAPPFSTADQIAYNSLQIEAIRSDPAWADGRYYDSRPGQGPHRGLALARRMAMMGYRSPDELNERFGRSWQSQVSPILGRGKFAVESYLDFHGNKFVRRFDANSYLVLVAAMSSHDIGRERKSVDNALAQISCPTLLLGISSDRQFPLSGQEQIATSIGGKLIDGGVIVLDSDYGHDGFLIETQRVSAALAKLLDSAMA
jgi:homoserine O-acetyltransferase